MTRPSTDPWTLPFAWVRTCISRWRFVLATSVLGIVISTAATALRPPVYVARSALFFAKKASPLGSLSSLAGSIGMQVSGEPEGPDFLADLLRSEQVIRRVATAEYSPVPGKKVPVLQAFGDDTDAEEERLAAFIKVVRDNQLDVQINSKSGIVDLTVSSGNPSLSYAIATALIREANELNVRLRADQGAAERRFAESLLKMRDDSLRHAEDRLRDFLSRNREIGLSSEGALLKRRLEREIEYHVENRGRLLTLVQEARLREVRDTPVLAVVEEPRIPALPKSRGHLKWVMVGFFLGLFFGMGYALIADTVRSS
jgi:uncharacterized protein involved in exopolysaccharide biosynthesis